MRRPDEATDQVRLLAPRPPADPVAPAIVIYDLDGELFFGAAPELDRYLDTPRDRISSGDVTFAVLRLKRVRHPDAVCIERLAEFPGRRRCWVHRLDRWSGPGKNRQTGARIDDVAHRRAIRSPVSTQPDQDPAPQLRRQGVDRPVHDPGLRGGPHVQRDTSGQQRPPRAVPPQPPPTDQLTCESDENRHC